MPMRMPPYESTDAEEEAHLVEALMLRAAALTRLEFHVVAVTDIERGLDLNHPGWRDPVTAA